MDNKEKEEAKNELAGALIGIIGAVVVLYILLT